jgi:putative transposase
MQIFGLPSNVNRLVSYTLRQEAQQQEIVLRHKLLGDWERLKQFRVPDPDIARITGISRATYFRRKRALAAYGTQGLARRSQRPKRFRQSAIPKPVRDLVMNLRRQHPSYGKAKLTVLLARDHGIRLSESTVGRILADLMRRGLVVRYADATRIVRKRKFDGHARRWAYDLRPKAPGEMIQVDHMSVNKHNIALKHFQAWDPISKYAHGEVYANATSANAARFLDAPHPGLLLLNSECHLRSRRTRSCRMRPSVSMLTAVAAGRSAACGPALPSRRRPLCRCRRSGWIAPAPALS